MVAATCSSRQPNELGEGGGWEGGKASRVEEGKGRVGWSSWPSATKDQQGRLARAVGRRLCRGEIWEEEEGKREGGKGGEGGGRTAALLLAVRAGERGRLGVGEGKRSIV